MTKQEKLARINEAYNGIKPYANHKIVAKIESVSKSGMSRTISFYAIDPQCNDLINITRYIGILTDNRANAKGYGYGLHVTGCGMDMIFHVLSCLNYAICRHENKDMSWPELNAKYGRIYDNYFINANNYKAI